MTTDDLLGTWVRLELVRAGDGLRAEAIVGPDLRGAPPPAPPAGELRLAVGGHTVTIPAAALAAIAHAARASAEVAPVFVAPHRSARALPWEDQLAPALAHAHRTGLAR